MERDLFDGDFYRKLNTIKLHVRMPLNKGASGGRKSTAKGSSLEFSDFREYLSGDDLRHIDWNAYGRTDKLLVKLFMEEKEGRFHIFVDGSPSMDFGRQKKSTYALRTAGALAYLVLNNLDRVYLHTISKDGPVFSPGHTGKQAFMKLQRQLSEGVFQSAADLFSLVKKGRFYGRGTTILLSDFYMDNLEEMVKYLAYKKQEVILIHILSREELNPEMEGNLELIDQENDERLRVTMGKGTRQSYDDRLKAFLADTQEICKKYGAAYIFAPADIPMEKLFFESFNRAGILR